MKKRIGAALLSFAMLAALFVPSVIPARAEADNAITPVLTTTPAPTATANTNGRSILKMTRLRNDRRTHATTT